MIARRRALVPAAALLTALVVVVPQQEAYAGDAASIGDVQTQLAGCTATADAPLTITLTAAISDPATSLTVPCAARIVLMGHDLTVSAVTVSSGDSLTVDDPSPSGSTGTLTAQGLGSSGGIRLASSSFQVDGGAVVASTVVASSAGTVGISRGRLVAGDSATLQGTGIDVGDGGVLAVSGGSVEATGGFGGAGVSTGDDGAVLVAGGALTGTGGNGGAGVVVGARGVVVAVAGVLEATGGANAAGVDLPATARMTVSGGVVTAAGGASGAGIGTGSGAADAGGRLEISGGSVTATGGSQASGFGGGLGSSPGPLVMTGGTLTASAPADGTALGVDATSAPLAIQGGLLRLPSGTLRLPDSSNDASPELVIGVNATLDGSDPKLGPQTYATYTGAGQLKNIGVVRVPEAVVTGVQVTNDYHRVTFDSRGGTPAAGGPSTVLAPSFSKAGMAFPASPRKTGQDFTGWNTKPDGSGTPITATGQLPGSASGGLPAAVTAYAVFVVRPPVLTAKVSSPSPKSPAGFYRAGVTIRWTCTRGTLPLAGKCPATVVLGKEGRGLSVTRSISDTGGHRASRTVAGLNIDRTAPAVSVTGVRAGATYAAPRRVGCRASDRLAGVRSCAVTTKRVGKRVDYTLRGTDRAGNVRVVRGSYRLR